MIQIGQFIYNHIAAYASDPLGLGGLLSSGDVGNGAIQTDPHAVNAIIANVITIALTIAGLVAFIMIVIAGFNYITSSGEDSKIERSKKTITTAVIGLVIIAFSYFITHALMSILGLPSYFSFGSILSILNIK